MSNLDTCMGCNKATCSGVCHCTADPERRPVTVLADLHACPMEKFPPRGLGDAIAKVTHAVGIKKCGGCAKRQALANKLVPFKKD